MSTVCHDCYYRFPEVDHLAPPIVQLDEMTFKYPGSDRILFNKVDITACMESRICVVSTSQNVDTNCWHSAHYNTDDYSQ